MIDSFCFMRLEVRLYVLTSEARLLVQNDNVEDLITRALSRDIGIVLALQNRG